MSNPIKIFICHKKLLVHEKGGATFEQENIHAGVLCDILKKDERYQPWIDNQELPAGIPWERTMYQELLTSEVLLLAVGPGTAKSEWVRREVALAVAFGITVLPLGYGVTAKEFESELKGIEVDNILGRLTSTLNLASRDALLKELEPALEFARKTTVKVQAAILEPLNERRSVAAKRAENSTRAFSLQATLGGKSIRLSVASGDLLATRDIDVPVNSENNYMQMVRYFEARTVSSLLRRVGTSLDGGRYVDTIQHELDARLGDRWRPVPAFESFVTSTGRPDSVLASKVRARCIIHVAAVQVLEGETSVVPYRQPDPVRACVASCLSKLGEINAAKGVCAGHAAAQTAEEARRRGQGCVPKPAVSAAVSAAGHGAGRRAGCASHPAHAGRAAQFSRPRRQSGHGAGDRRDLHRRLYRARPGEGPSRDARLLSMNWQPSMRHGPARAGAGAVALTGAPAT